MTLTDAELDRYQRQIILPQFGGAGQVALRNAHVAVLGAGGIGCPAIQALAVAGIGHLTIIDDDVVALDNLPRQMLFSDADIGRPKALCAAETVARLNPHVAVVTRQERITADNVATLLDENDIVLDGTDNFATRLIVSDYCTAAQTPLVSAAIGQFQGQIGLFRGWEVGQPCYRCFVGDAFDAEDCDTCAELGVLGAMSATVANWAAMEVIRALVNSSGGNFGPDQAGKVQVFDGVAPSLRTIRIVKDPACKGCGGNPCG